MIDFSPLDGVFEAAERQGRSLTFWWRDDDAIEATPALDRLLEMSRRHGAPLALAVIPALFKPSLVARLRDCEDSRVLVHGYAHANHAPRDAKKAEFGSHRQPQTMTAEAVRSLSLMSDAFPETVLTPVFVPPWNRIAPDFPPLLAASGYTGLSTFGERTASEATPGLIRINTHLDPIDWHNGRGLKHPAALIAGLADAARRRLRGETLEPLGILTHHLVHDEDTWRFCDSLIGRIQAAPAANFADVRRLL